MTISALPQPLVTRIDSYWSALLGCVPSELRPAHPTIIVSDTSPGLTALRLNENWVVAAHPDYGRTLAENVLSQLQAIDIASRTDHDALHQSLRELGFPEFYGPSELLYLTRDMLVPVQSVTFRTLQPADAAVVDEFRAGMGGVLDWHIDDPERWPYVIGHFAEDRLIAAAAVCNWGDVVAETYVDTLPEFRGRGLATALTYEITRWIVEETPWIAQAGGEVINTPSGRIARRLGYELYGYLFMNNLARQP
ncbi:MAG: GNAT family N-acetyltransferase [Candidatus Flexifilum sp.]|jgi:GNAT superfamily N-acetyltransferase|nr:MAG: hypothetical protein CUN53_00035 [Phototrophicales bacterium]